MEEALKTQTAPWVQTLSFKSDEFIANQGYLLIKHRSTMKNFMRMTNRLQPSTNETPVSPNMLMTHKKLITMDPSKSNHKQKRHSMPHRQEMAERSMDMEEKIQRSERIEKFNRYTLHIQKIKRLELDGLQEKNSQLNCSIEFPPSPTIDKRESQK